MLDSLRQQKEAAMEWSQDDPEKQLRFRLWTAEKMRDATEFCIRLVELALLMAVFRAAAVLVPGLASRLAMWFVNYAIPVMFLYGYFYPVAAWLMHKHHGKRFVFLAALVVVMIGSLPVIVGIKLASRIIATSEITQFQGPPNTRTMPTPTPTR
jgi:hypothetical protein